MSLEINYVFIDGITSLASREGIVRSFKPISAQETLESNFRRHGQR